MKRRVNWRARGTAVDHCLYFCAVKGRAVFDELLLADARSRQRQGLEMGHDIRRRGARHCTRASSVWLEVRKRLLKCHSTRPSYCRGWKKAGGFCGVQTRARPISTCLNLLQFRWILALRLDFISPQCSQKLQTSYTRSPECVLYPISVKFQQCLIVFPSLQSDTLPYEER